MANLSRQLLDLAIQIQQIPAPTFSEQARAEFVHALLLKEDLQDVSLDALGNVYARLAGKHESAPPLIVSAHMDTVFPPGIGLEIKEQAGKVLGPGLGDNSLGVAALFGILWALRERKIELEHDLWLVANVGEEGLGDLRGMRAVVDRFGKTVIGYLVLEGLALGHIYYRAIGVKRYRVEVRTTGGHSWSDYGKPSAVHELAALVTKLTSMPLPSEPRTTMNVGTIRGGTGVNVLAADATCEVDLRSEDPAILMKLADQVEACLRAAGREGVEAQVQVIGQRPAGEISPDHALVQWAVVCTRQAGLEAVLTSGSTDANVPLSRGIPAVVMGITTGGGAHTAHEYIDPGPISKGLDALVGFVSEVGNKAGS